MGFACLKGMKSKMLSLVERTRKLNEVGEPVIRQARGIGATIIRIAKMKFELQAEQDTLEEEIGNFEITLADNWDYEELKKVNLHNLQAQDLLI